MASTATYNVVFLHESELRIAAKALAAARFADEAEAPEEQRGELWSQAMLACVNALYGAERDDVALMIANAEVFKPRSPKPDAAKDLP